MEVNMFACNNLPEGAIFSVRAGQVRRQAAAAGNRPFRFPAKPLDSPLKIEVFKPVGTAYVVLRTNEDQYKLKFVSAGEETPMSCEMHVKSVEGGSAAPPTPGAEEPKEGSTSSKEAREYLESHAVMQFVQSLLQTLIKDKPADPFAYMSRHFQSGYEPHEQRSPLPANIQSTPASPAMKAVQEAMKEVRPRIKAPKPPPSRRDLMRMNAKDTFLKASLDGSLQNALGQKAPKQPVDLKAVRAEAKEALAKANADGYFRIALTSVAIQKKYGLVDVSDITRVAKNNLGLLPQPVNIRFKTALVQIYVRGAPYGGSDKSSNGHRYDSIPIANGMINAGMSCQLIHYIHEEHDAFFKVCKKFDAVIVRCNPGQIKSDGGDQAKFDEGMRELRKLGIQVWPSPDVMEQMGAKDALCKVASLNIGLEDTLAYYTEEDFAAGFKKTMAFQPRVIKQNRGSSGEGIWIVKLKAGNYCSTYGERSCADDEVLDLMEANDNHSEQHTVGEFVEFCVNGRTAKSGEWTSKGVGKYLEGGKAAGGQLVDQRFCPRIVEGELRYNMVGNSLVGIIHKKPKEGGISAVGGTGSVYTFYGPDEPLFKNLTENFLNRDLQKVMPALGLADEPIPLWWTTDFILSSPVGTPAAEEKWIVGEFNCSCVGISKCLPAYCKDDTPHACYNDIPPEDVKEAQRMGDLMGMKALGILVGPVPSDGPVDISSITRIAKDDLGLLPQPESPKFKCALAQIFVRAAPYGGSDKSSNGHRYDSIPIANGMINAGMSCQLVHYVHQEHDKFFEVCKKFDAIIVRCNPGQIKADGGDQGQFDDGMRAIRKLGIQVWPSPDVMEQMGAKDALCKVAGLNIGLEDTLAYYTEEEFAAGFKKTMAFQPRVIKQNRGSSGEGIWIIKLKEGNYCESYGERSCADDEILDLMEANDNHAEEHTVAEFIEFCVNGRTAKSGEWTSKGVGKYLEGGKAAGGQLVDQRFCPRIVEGELRYNMVGDALVGIIHKKPKEGGISAVGGTGSVYTFYGPEEPLFKNLTDNFLQRDLEKVMPALGLADEPIPLWWTTDFILSSPEGTPAEEEKWIVGEFNCSCVGISKCLPAYCKDDTPAACFSDIPEEDLAEAKRMGDLMGEKALGILGGAADASSGGAADASSGGWFSRAVGAVKDAVGVDG